METRSAMFVRTLTLRLRFPLIRSVRFLDNFSAGTRGAASAEQFLRTGEYAVIFLHRQHSLQPFSRHYSHSTNPFLDMLEVVTAEGSFPSRQSTFGASKDGHPRHLFPNLHALAVHRASLSDEDSITPSSSTSIQVKASEQKTMKAILESYKLVQSLHLLHSIPFVTVFEYLFLLRGISQIMNGDHGQGVGRKSLFYLAAAVSDFFLPQQKMVSFGNLTSGKCLARSLILGFPIRAVSTQNPIWQRLVGN